MGILDYQQPEQPEQGTLGNLSPQQIGLLNAGLSMMMAPKYAPIGNGLVRGTSLGERIAPGIQQGLSSMQQAQQDQNTNKLQQYQMAQSFAKTKKELDKEKKDQAMQQELGSLDVNDINGLKKVLLKYSTSPSEILKSLLPDANKSTFEFLNTDQGIVKGNKSTGSIERAMLDNAIVRNSNASPELQGQIASAKTHGSEMQKIFKTTDENGNEIFPTGSEVTGNNYGNIRPQGSDTGFQSYPTPEAGLAAIDQNLQAYGTKHGINTLSGVINRWSPPSENNTDSYIKHVSNILGLDPNQPIDLSNPVVRQAIGTGIMAHEGSLKKVFGQSAAQKANIDVNKALQIEQGKNNLDVQKAIDTDRAAALMSAKKSMPLYEQALKLLPDVVNGGADSMLNSTMNYLGIPTEKSKAQGVLETVANELTASIKKAPGSQSDKELVFAQKQAGDLANQSLPIETRMAAAKYLYDRNQKILNGEPVQDPEEQQKSTVIKYDANGNRIK